MAQATMIADDAATSVFSVRQATTSKDLQKVFSLRYQVYCLERGFESPEDCLGAMETDEYDSQAIHFLAVTSDDIPLGTVRLVLDSAIGFPLEKHCLLTQDLSSVRAKSAEISRLAISKVFRSRDQLRQKCSLLQGLLRVMYLASVERGLEYWPVAMERSLFILLKRMGMIFKPIGEETDYHGLRTPYLGCIAEIESTVALRRPDLYVPLGGPVAHQLANV